MKKKLIAAWIGILAGPVAFFSQSAENIAALDKNFRPSMVGKLQVNYYNALKKPFEVTGFAWWKEGEALYRLPKHFTKKEINPGALRLANFNSGGAVRFKTDSPYMTLRVDYSIFADMSHMPRSGSNGFDLYSVDADGKERYLNTAIPSRDNENAFEWRFQGIPDKFPLQLRSYIIYLPLYGGVKNMEIGIKPGCRILPPDPQRISRPIVFYGASITQGAAASRPANNYTTLLCRAVDAPEVNLGFSGNSLGEIALAEAIGKLDAAAFVMDYDYGSLSDLKKTHEPFFKAVRKANPDQTYDNAVKNGDKKVWFINGGELFGKPGMNMCTVDGTHPNDLGFYMMYVRILPVLREALGLKNLQ